MAGDESRTTEASVTFDSACASAARLLSNAELETDLARMERVEKIADSWISLAGLLHQHQREA